MTVFSLKVLTSSLGPHTVGVSSVDSSLSQSEGEAVVRGWYFFELDRL